MPESVNKKSGSSRYVLKRDVFLPVAISTVGIFIMAYIGYSLRSGGPSLLTISEYEVVNFTFTMQLYSMPLSFAGLLFMYVNDINAYRKFFRFSLRTSEGNGSTWKKLGPLLAVVLTIGTILLMSLDVVAGHGEINNIFLKLFPLVIVFAATNAWTEEILSRFIIVAGLDQKIKPHTICLISAILFGVPHFFGTPSGIFGVILTGIMGWLMAKSVIETKSMGWALLIHFLQDVVIFGAGSMLIAGSA